MLTDLMQEQQRKLVQLIQERPGYVSANTVAALALLDILDILTDIRNPMGAPSGD